jgi:hypothetical protein
VRTLLLLGLQSVETVPDRMERTCDRTSQPERGALASWGGGFVTTTALPAMIVDDVDLRSRPSILRTHRDPMDCDHVWEPHLVETGRAYCPRCGSCARWPNDPRLVEEAAS